MDKKFKKRCELMSKPKKILLSYIELRGMAIQQIFETIKKQQAKNPEYLRSNY